MPSPPPSDPAAQIGLLTVPGVTGLLGLTACPGRPDRGGAVGGDLDRDLDAIAATGARCLVSLIEPHELVLLGLPEDALRLGCAARGMAWLHLPIADMGVPDAGFERAWVTAGASLHRRLEAGETVVIHCRAGLGRTGTIAARLLIERGLPADRAIALVRAARPGAIETAEQEAHLRSRASPSR